MRLSENKFLEKINIFSPIIKYIGIIITWYNLINSSDKNFFFSVVEKKIGVEIFLLSISFILIGLWQNSKKKSTDFKTYIGIFILLSLVLILGLWNDIQLLTSGLIILISNLLSFLSQCNEYGASANDIFISGRGSVFCFVLAVIYGIPTGLILKHFDLWGNIKIIGYSIIGYYFILLVLELRYIIKTI